MSFDAEHAACYNIANAEVRGYPFPHFYVADVFPSAFYAELLSKLPPTSVYSRLDETGAVSKGAYPERYICSIEEAEQHEFTQGTGDFWERFGQWIGGESFARLIVHKFRTGMLERFGDDVDVRIRTDVRLIRDFTNYSISPHTDTPRKLVSLLFYLPRDASRRHLGTSIYVPRDPAFRCGGTAHHPFEGFLKVSTAEYLPNSLLAFFKTDAAFHGVEPIGDEDVQRDVLLYNIFIEKIVPKPGARPPADWAERSADPWPWRTSATTA